MYSYMCGGGSAGRLVLSHCAAGAGAGYSSALIGIAQSDLSWTSSMGAALCGEMSSEA